MTPRYTKRPTGEQQTPEWYEARRQCIGASDAASMLMESPWGGPFTLWSSKTQGYEQDLTEEMRFGSAAEAYIIDRWARETGGAVELEPCTLIHADEERMGCNLDAWGIIGGERIVVEAKTCHWRGKDELQAYAEGRIAPTGKWAAYWIQVQHQLEITGCAMGHLAVLCDRDYWTVEIPRDEAFGRYLRFEIRGWWARHVVRGEMPGPAPQDVPALSRLTPEPGKSVDLPDLADVVEDLRDKAKAKAALDKDIRALKAQIQAAMVDAEVAHFGPEIKPVTWKETTRKAYSVAAKTYRTLRV